MKRIILLLLICFYQVSLAESIEKQSIFKLKTLIYLKNLETAKMSLDMLFEIDDVIRYVDFPDEISQISYTVDILLDLSESFPPPNINYIKSFGRGFDQKAAEEFQSFQTGILLTIAYPQSKFNKAIQTSQLISNNLAEVAGGFIWDVDTREIFTPKSWRTKRLHSWLGDIPNINSHIIIRAEKKPHSLVQTFGMNKFNLPELYMRDYDWALNYKVSELLALVAQSLVEGMTVDEDNIIHININDLEETSFKKKLVNGLNDKAELNFVLQLLSDESVDNILESKNINITVVKDDEDGLNNFVSELFKEYKQIPLTENKELILKASKKAKSELPQVKKIFNQKLDTINQILVKVPVKNGDQTDWIWAKVKTWNQDQLKVQLLNKPVKNDDYDLESSFIVLTKDIFDYAISFKDGFIKGGETDKLISSNK